MKRGERGWWWKGWWKGGLCCGSLQLWCASGIAFATERGSGGWWVLCCVTRRGVGRSHRICKRERGRGVVVVECVWCGVEVVAAAQWRCKRERGRGPPSRHPCGLLVGGPRCLPAAPPCSPTFSHSPALVCIAGSSSPDSFALTWFAHCSFAFMHPPSFASCVLVRGRFLRIGRFTLLRTLVRVCGCSLAAHSRLRVRVRAPSFVCIAHRICRVCGHFSPPGVLHCFVLLLPLFATVRLRSLLSSANQIQVSTYKIIPNLPLKHVLSAEI